LRENRPSPAKGELSHVTKLFNRLARPAIMAMALGSLAAPVMAQQSPLPQQAMSMLNMLSPSETGSYLAGQQALKELRTTEAARYFNEAAQSDWSNPILVERAFIGFAADGQIGQAASTAKHLLELDPTNELAELVVATEALKQRRYGAAESALDNIGQESFIAITGDVLRAWALVGDGKAKEAETELDKLGQGGLADFLLFHRALMAEAAGDTDKAIDLAGQAFDAEPNVARVVEVYARILANAGHFDQAKAAIAKFEGQGLTHPVVTIVKNMVDAGQKPGVFASSVQVGAAEMYHGIGVALARDGSMDVSIVFLRLALYLDPQADVISLALAQMLDQAGQNQAANAIYDAIPAASVMKPTAVVRIAQNLDTMGDRPEALRRLGNIVATRPGDLDAVSVLGDLLRYDEQFTAAADAYTKALAISGGNNPSDWRFYYVRGIAFERANEWPKAEADFLEALKLNPDQPQVLNYLGYSWIDKDMHYDEALGMIQKAVDAVPQDGYIVDSLGWAFYKLGRTDEAVNTLEQAVQLLPNDPEINDHLGDAYWKAGRELEAKFQWKIAASVDTIGNVKKRTIPKLANGLTASATP